MDRKTLSLNLLILLIVLGISLTLLHVGGSLKMYPVNLVLDYSQAKLPESKIIYEVRLPRLLVAILSGALFALAGSIFQIVYRNKLTSPDLLGINAAAICSVLLFSTLFPQHDLVLVYSLLGTTFGYLLTIILSGTKPTIAGGKLLIIGLALSIFFRCMSQLMLIKSSENLHSLIYFLNGSLATANWASIYASSLITVITLAGCFIFASKLQLMKFSNDLAQTIGQNIYPWQLFYIALALIMSALAVSLSGSFGFIGLIAPNLARALNPNRCLARFSLLLSMLIGICLTIFADLIAANLLYPNQIPAGLVMIFVGTPVFIYMLKNLKGEY